MNDQELFLILKFDWDVLILSVAGLTLTLQEGIRLTLTILGLGEFLLSIDALGEILSLTKNWMCVVLCARRLGPLFIVFLFPILGNPNPISKSLRS